MTGKLLLRGMIAGVVGGLLAFLFARLYGEPLIDVAIAFEEHAGAAHDAAEPEMVSRATQAGLGLLTGVVVYGAALGGILALAFAVVYGRFSRLGVRALAAIMALSGFVAVILVPVVKYPANPPAVGAADTIGDRTQLFFIMLLVSLALMIAAFALARRMRPRLGAWNAAIVAGLAYVLAIAVVMALLPEVNEVPDGFSAVLLWRFRLAALGLQAVIWATVGLLFGFLAERLVLGAPSKPDRRV
ncbi:CbtA family protein [Pleomorphomonas oryzae]|uniref:CbtA family protein n=1 Tax=Pleomorphomonas oryzae TaxID=261934 RepID=UPI00047E0BB3|nr:CbtA family protein [Pleomorphomonas oryzae]